MKLRVASEKLTAAICPSGPSFRPAWFTTLGINEKSKVLIVYASNTKLAHKALQNILTPDKKFQGFSVVVKKMGPIRLCKEDLRQEPSPDAQPASKYLTEEDKAAWDQRMKDLEDWGEGKIDSL